MNKYSQVFFTSIILSSLIALTGCSSNAPILGVDNGQLTPCPDKPNCVNSFAEDEAHHINPIVSKGSDGFVDDVEFYFPESSINQTTIHVRSASRLGYSDFNVNRERVESLRLKLEALEK